MVCLNKHEKDMTDYLLSSAEIKNTEELCYLTKETYTVQEHGLYIKIEIIYLAIKMNN